MPSAMRSQWWALRTTASRSSERTCVGALLSGLVVTLSATVLCPATLDLLRAYLQQHSARGGSILVQQLLRTGPGHASPAVRAPSMAALGMVMENARVLDAADRAQRDETSDEVAAAVVGRSWRL